MSLFGAVISLHSNYSCIEKITIPKTSQTQKLSELFFLQKGNEGFRQSMEKEHVKTKMTSQVRDATLRQISESLRMHPLIEQRTKPFERGFYFTLIQRNEIVVNMYKLMCICIKYYTALYYVRCVYVSSCEF